MTQEIKTAIKSAEKRLEEEHQARLTNEIHEYLKSELTSIENLENQIRTLETQKRVHEENIKNIKSGNIKAIEERRKFLLSTNAFGDLTVTSRTLTTATNGGGGWTTYTSSANFYNNYVAGFTYETPNGKVYIF